MILYLTANNQFVGTQADAKQAGKGWRQVEVPTDKPGLIRYLNTELSMGASLPAFRNAELAAQTSEQELIEDADDLLAPEPTPVKRDMGATATLSRMDNPSTDVDAVVETIGKAKGYALKRYAGAVAVAFQELGK